MQHRPEPSPSASSTSQAAREPNASRLADAEAVREVITQVMHTIDAKAWNELRELFADPVSTDYT
ncbi:MAG TPA: nuclear transport factor 2 family protein, partial [Sandaracinaceae bacterium]